MTGGQCPAEIHRDRPDRLEPQVIRCDREPHDSGVHWNDRAGFLWSDTR